MHPIIVAPQCPHSVGERESAHSVAAAAMARLVCLAAAAVLLILLQSASAVFAANDIVLGRKGRLTIDETAEKENTAASSAGGCMPRSSMPGARAARGTSSSLTTRWTLSTSATTSEFFAQVHAYTLIHSLVQCRS
jgi:hypothetical protein